MSNMYDKSAMAAFTELVWIWNFLYESEVKKKEMIILQGILKLLSWAIAARKDDVKENKKKVIKWAIATTSTSVK